MRRFVAAFFLVIVPACRGGGSPLGGSTTSSGPTSPSETPAEDRAEARGRVCAEYVACIAKKAPEMLDPVTDAYGKSGSCWTEMSKEACEDACAAGKTKAQCGVCDPALGSCLGEACGSLQRCAAGETCSKGTCIEDWIGKACGASDGDSECPAPYECTGAGDGYACLLPCAADGDCPLNLTCSESYGLCVQ